MKENQRTMLTKKLLKGSLLSLLKEKELDLITITELCSRAQINRTTFYRYYKLPADVLSEIADDLVTEMRTSIEKIKTTAEAKTFLTKMCDKCMDKSGLLNYILRSDYSSSHTVILEKLYERSNTTVFNNDNIDEEYPKIVATYFAGGAYLILRMWVAGEISRTPEEMASLLWEIMTGDYSVLANKLK